MQSEKFKVTPLERSWILYDVGNSAFVLMIATLVPIFFNALAEAGGLSPVNYLAYWGYASSVVTVITAVLGPILGTLADTRGFKKPIFMLCLFVGVAGCCAMGLATTWLPFLIIFILAKIGFSGSLVHRGAEHAEHPLMGAHIGQLIGHMVFHKVVFTGQPGKLRALCHSALRIK